MLPNIFSYRLKDKVRPSLSLAVLAVDTNYSQRQERTLFAVLRLYRLAMTDSTRPSIRHRYNRLQAQTVTTILSVRGTVNFQGSEERLTLFLVFLLPGRQGRASRVNPGRLLYFVTFRPSRMAFNSTAIHSRLSSISTWEMS